VIFGPTDLADALGAVLAHSVSLPSGKLPKGKLVEPADLAALAAAGITRIMAARPEPGDVTEDAAANRLGAALWTGAEGLSLTQAHTGRVNLVATRPGLLDFDVEAVHDLNRVQPAITLATLPPLTRLSKGSLAGTVKIITYAVTGSDLTAAEGRARLAGFRNLPVTRFSASLIQTQTPDDTGKLANKGRDAVARRLRALGVTLVEVIEVPHREPDLAQAIASAKGAFVLVLTGAATSDPADVAPSALRQAGGHVARFGMPVDPGNLLFHGTLGPRPVIGLPGCARSPAVNGADWVLERVSCGLDISDEMIARMGVGGLLKEIPIRPEPRQR
jgi:molybdenum cofactor cytidylyltransferase